MSKFSFSPQNYPLSVQEALAPITSVSKPSHQGMTSFVTFAETRLGPVAIKHAVGIRLAALRREKNILDALDTSALPVPECLLYHEVETAQGQDGWLVMRRLPGQPLLQLFRTDDRAGLTHALNNLGNTLARLHATRIPHALSIGPHRWLEDMLEQAETNLALGLWKGTQTQLEELKQKRPASITPRLIHGDLFLDNVLSDGMEITGLIDWAFGGAGDPRYDLAVATYELSASEQEAFLEGYGIKDLLSSFDADYFRKLALFC